MSSLNPDEDQKWLPTHVQVTVLKGRGLRGKGKNGTSDVYTIIQLGKEKYSTCVVEKTTEPEWREECTFELHPSAFESSGSNELVLTVMHRALIGLDVFLGQAVIPLGKVFTESRGVKNEWYRLNSKTGKKEKERGDIQVTVQFTRNNLTASMYDLVMKDKSMSTFFKLKERMRGKRRSSEEDSSSAILPEHTANTSPKLSSHKCEFGDEAGEITIAVPQPSVYVNGSHSLSVQPLDSGKPAASLGLGLLKPLPLSVSLQNLSPRANTDLPRGIVGDGRRWSFDKPDEDEKAAIAAALEQSGPLLNDTEDQCLGSTTTTSSSNVEPDNQGKKQRMNLFSHGRSESTGKGSSQSKDESEQAPAATEDKHRGWFGSKDSHSKPSPHPVKPLTTATAAEEKRTEGRSVLATGLEKLKSTIHPGRSSQTTEESDRKKSLTEGAGSYYHLTHSELVALLVQREVELERQKAEFEQHKTLLAKREAELKRLKPQVKDLEDYIDTLLVRIMEQKPTLLQVRSKFK